jgi:hypothetical protein
MKLTLSTVAITLALTTACLAISEPLSIVGSLRLQIQDITLNGGTMIDGELIAPLPEPPVLELDPETGMVLNPNEIFFFVMDTAHAMYAIKGSLQAAHDDYNDERRVIDREHGSTWAWSFVDRNIAWGKCGDAQESIDKLDAQIQPLRGWVLQYGDAFGEGRTPPWQLSFQLNSLYYQALGLGCYALEIAPPHLPMTGNPHVHDAIGYLEEVEQIHAQWR